MAVVEIPWDDATAAAQMQVIWQRNVSGKPTQDVAVTKLSFLNTTGEMDHYNPAIPNSDMGIVEEEFGGFWGAVNEFAHTSHGLAQFRWYRLTTPSAPALGPMRVNTQGAPAAGTDTESLPPQVAINVTLEVAFRKNWGRMCLPLTGDSGRADDGRVTTAAVDAIAEAAQTMFDTINGSSTFRCVVYSAPGGFYNDILGVRVDDTYDIIRRRRYEGVPYRALLPVTS
jgi:hypothetical protein